MDQDGRDRGPAGSPPVVVVVVTHDAPAERFDALLAALAVQDHPNYRVLVIDTGREIDPTDRVMRALPDARVLRVPPDLGYGAAANHVLDVVEGAAFYVFAHDDVAPEPDALSELVEAARTWDAAVVGPKLVDWDDPRRLRQVGVAVDRLGTTMPFAEPGELDQAQHDGLREVISVPGAFTLVDAPLFERIGGFDEAITFLGDDLSLCWRARVAGARVLVASGAKVRHAEGFAERATPDERRRLVGRHRLRALLTCYGPLQLTLTVIQALAMTAGGAVGALFTGRPGRARDAVGAWLWNLRRWRSLLVARRHVRSIRRVPDRRIRRLQVQGLIGPRLQLRRVGGEAKLQAALAEAGAAPSAGAPTTDERGTWTPGTVLVAAALAGALAFGSRHLLTRYVPAVGELVPLEGAGGLVAEWAGGWRHTGLGSATAAPTLVGVVGALGAVAGGALGLVRTVVTVGLLPLGVVGAYRLMRPTRSRRVQVAAAVAYAAVPVPYNALAGGRWSALALYAGLPWLLGRLARVLGDAPFRPVDAPLIVVAHSVVRHALAVGAVTALVGLLVPYAPLVLLAVGAALALGSLLAFRATGVVRLAAVTALGAVVAAALHLPTMLDVVRSGARLEAWLGVERHVGDLAAVDLLRFHTGPFGGSAVGFALLVAAAAPLLAGRSWRLQWAIRGWTVAVGFWGLAWAQQEGAVALPLPHPDVLLAPAGAGLALAASLAVATIEHDLGDGAWRFGFRRLSAAAGAAALAVSLAPVVGGAVDGWWRMPQGDFQGVLAFVERDVTDVPSRVLWLGDPDVLPGGGGQAWRDGVSYAATLEGGPGVRDLWPGPAEGADARLGEVLDIAVERRTTRLGRLLAPMGVQYIAVPARVAPSPYTSEERPVPEEVTTALGAQLDLEQVPLDPAVTLYRNTAFAPARSLVADTSALDATDVEALQRVDLSRSFPVLLAHDGAGYRGTVPAGFTLVHAAPPGRWELSVEGTDTEGRGAYGWASAFDTGSGGDAVLSYRTSVWYRALLGLQVALWLAVAVAVARMRYSAGEGRAAAEPPVPEPEPETSASSPAAPGPLALPAGPAPPGSPPHRTLEIEPVAGPPAPGRELVR